MDARFFATAFFVLFGLVVVIMSIVRGRQFYQLATDLALARSELRALKTQQNSQHEALDLRLTQAERTLYEEPNMKSPPPPRRPSFAETWSANRDKELRRRITDGEYRDFHMDAELTRLRRMVEQMARERE